jgi:hypothetical protein
MVGMKRMTMTAVVIDVIIMEMASMLDVVAVWVGGVFVLVVSWVGGSPQFSFL